MTKGTQKQTLHSKVYTRMYPIPPTIQPMKQSLKPMAIDVDFPIHTSESNPTRG
uniref:Uncharacterized protein n=1 Tax=Amphimedon queenslandica TaxID=400682 RepID=A0A1X7VD03_AMPQE